jgi:hypothetical protein
MEDLAIMAEEGLDALNATMPIPSLQKKKIHLF